MQNNNLDTFRILFLWYGIILIIFFTFLVSIYAFAGISMLESDNVKNETFFKVHSIILVIGIIGFFLLVIIGVLNIISSNYLKKKKQYNFIFIMSIVNCFTGLLGILLGVFTLIELNKAEVKALFKKEDLDKFSETKSN